MQAAVAQPGRRKRKYVLLPETVNPQRAAGNTIYWAKRNPLHECGAGGANADYRCFALLELSPQFGPVSL
jgi:hypothetical protein